MDHNKNIKLICPHCGKKLSQWNPPDLSTWQGIVQYVCFNNICPYFIKGWKWMASHYGVKASYRYRYNPQNGESGPLPVQQIPNDFNKELNNVK